MDELSSGSGADSSTLVTDEYLGVGALFRKRRGQVCTSADRGQTQIICSATSVPLFLLHQICQFFFFLFLQWTC